MAPGDMQLIIEISAAHCSSGDVEVSALSVELWFIW